MCKYIRDSYVFMSMNKISHHLPVIQISNVRGLDSKNYNERQTQFYDFCNSKVKKFVSSIEKEFDHNPPPDFDSFNENFHSLLDKACKLKKPKNSKRTMSNNPWITESIINAIDKKHELYQKWRKTISKKLPNGNIKVYEYFKSYSKHVKKIIKYAKSNFYCSKILEHGGNKKKTWEVINNLRGKQKRQMKPQFIIDNEKVINRRIISNEFNKYFASIAEKMNNKSTDNSND